MQGDKVAVTLVHILEMEFIINCRQRARLLLFDSLRDCNR